MPHKCHRWAWCEARTEKHCHEEWRNPADLASEGERLLSFDKNAPSFLAEIKDTKGAVPRPESGTQGPPISIYVIEWVNLSGQSGAGEWILE